VPVLGERADGVAHHARPVEEIAQRLDRVVDFDDLVDGGLDPGDVVLHRLLHALAAAPGGDEGEAVLTQVLAHEPPGVAAGAVDDDGLAAAHGSSPLRRRVTRDAIRPPATRPARVADRSGRHRECAAAGGVLAVTARHAVAAAHEARDTSNGAVAVADHRAGLLSVRGAATVRACADVDARPLIS
jgi:hypothetical protein